MSLASVHLLLFPVILRICGVERETAGKINRKPNQSSLAIVLEVITFTVLPVLGSKHDSVTN